MLLRAKILSLVDRGRVDTLIVEMMTVIVVMLDLWI